MLRRCVNQNKRVCTLLSPRRRDVHTEYHSRFHESGGTGGEHDMRFLKYLSGVAAVTGLVAASTNNLPSRDELQYWDYLYDTGQLDELTKQLQPYAEVDNAELLWRRARAEWAWNKGIKFATSGYQKRRLEDSLEMIDRALDLDGSISNVYLCKAVLIKAQCQLSGTPSEQIAGMGEMRSLLETAMELDPENGAAAQLLAMWHFEVSQIGWIQRTVFAWWGKVPEGSLQKALHYAWRAQEVQSSTRNLLVLAKIYNGLGDSEKAKNYVAMALELPSNTPDDMAAVEEAAQFKRKIR